MTRAIANDMIRRTQTYAILNAGRIDTPGCHQLAALDSRVWRVKLQAAITNTASVFVGNQWRQPYEMVPGSELDIPIDSTRKVYVILTAGDAVSWEAQGSAVSSPFPSAYTQKVIGYGPIAYWTQGDPLLPTAVEQIDSPAQDGTYSAAGVTLGQQGIGDGLTSALYDGIAGHANIFSAALQAAFTPAQGTVFIWGMVTNAGVWTDAAQRRMFELAVANPNRVLIGRDGINNQLQFQYRAGGVISQVLYVTIAPVVFFSAAITWDVNAGPTGEVRAFYNGAQVGATVVGLGVWVGNLSATRTVIGAQMTAPTLLWSGNLSDCAVWDRALLPGEVADLATV